VSGWVNAVGTFLVNLIPELIVGVVLGVVILIIEYWTGWFAEHTSIMKTSGDGGKISKVGNSLKPVMDFIGGAILILLFVLFLAVLGYATTSEDRHETKLDNPDDERTVLAAIREGDTVSIFGNDLFITVSNFTRRGFDIKENQIDYVLGKAGYENLEVEDATVGSTVTYETNNKYFVRLSSTTIRLNGIEVHFVVTILEEDGDQSQEE